MGPRALKEHGSAPWCWQAVTALADYYHTFDYHWRQVEQTRTDLRAVRAWEVIPSERPYGSEDAMLLAELGVTGAQLDAHIIVKRMEAAALDAKDQGEKVHQPHGGDHGNQYTGGKIDNIQLATVPTGTSAQAAIRRLRSQRPDLHARVLSGELSPHAAAVEAGFRPRTLSIPLDPDRIANTLCRHLSPEQLRTLVCILSEHIAVEA